MSDHNEKSMNQPQISFSGGGFLGVYHCGVLKCMMERAPHFLERVGTFYGTSVGAVVSTCGACGLDAMATYRSLKFQFEDAKHYWGGVYNPFFDVYGRLREFLEGLLPEDAHRTCRNVVKIGLSVLQSNGRLKNWVVTDFRTRKELINVRDLHGTALVG